MRRSDLLFVTGMTTTTFNALSVRGLLPFATKRLDRAWATFDVETALRLALFVDLAATGMSQVRASDIVRNGFDDFLDFANSKPKPEDAAYLFGGATLVVAASKVLAQVDPKVLPVCAVQGRVDQAVERATMRLAGHYRVQEISVINASNSMARIVTGLRSLQHHDGEVAKWVNFMRVR